MTRVKSSTDLEPTPGARVLKLVLFTQSYPYDTASEQTFVGTEIPYLLEAFEKVVVVPRSLKGNRSSLPGLVEGDERYAEFLRRNLRPHRVRRQALRMMLQEVRERPSILPDPAKLLKLILFSVRAELTREWMSSVLGSHQIDSEACILYSYWFDHAAAGLTMVKKEFPEVRVVSRAHGYDIFEEHYFPHYWPRRRETLEGLDKLFLASNAGRQYFMDRYPEFSSKYETAHLGIHDPGFVSTASDDDVFRIVSCSNIVPIKRLSLLADGIAAAARLRPDQVFEWTHIGDGVGWKSLERRVARIFPANVTSRLLGSVSNPEVLNYYRDHPTDAFVNVSLSEGGAPVSIQEAIGSGIPVVAASVGGNPEIVSESNGILLSPNPSAHEIAQAFLRMCDNPTRAASMREESRRIWKERFDADVNLRSFAQQLRNLAVRRQPGALR